MDGSSLRRPAAGAVALAIAAFAGLYALAFASPGIDFWRPWVASRASIPDVYSRDGRERLYRSCVPAPGEADATSRERRAAASGAEFDRAFLGYAGIDVVQTPLLLSLFRVLGSGDYERDYRVYLAISLACFLGGSFALGRMLGFSVGFALVTAAALGFALAAEMSELAVGNVNNLQLALLVGFLALQRRSSAARDAASGALLALGIAFKPNVALIAVAIGLAWIGSGLWRKSAVVGAGFALGALVAVAAPSLLLAPSAWSGWLAVVPELLESSQPLAFGNFALSAVVAERWGLDVSRILLGLGLLLLAAAALRPRFVQPSRRLGDDAFDRTLFAVAAGAGLLLLASRLVWIHYGVLAVPALLLVVRAIRELGGARAWALALALIPLSRACMILLTLLAGSSLWAAVATNASLLVLFGWSLGCLWRSGVRTVSPRLARPVGAR